MNTHQLLTVREACAIARVSDHHIRDLCARGEIKAVKIGNLWRINRASFMAYMGLDDSEVSRDGSQQ